MRKVTPALERFWAKVDRGGPDECWEWQAGTTSFGYGAFHPIKGTTVGAHRYSLEIHLGRRLKPGSFCCHTCDNPKCVNPSHLYEGNSATNVADAVSRRRHKHGTMGPTKLDESDILAIRHRAHNGEKNVALADEYGVNDSLISMITRGTRWVHVGGPISGKYKTRKAS